MSPICADGASVGWNYLSAPRDGKQLVYRWWCDEEFGTIFFHDHLFANYRQKHGLFAALIAEPPRSQWHTADQEDTAVQIGFAEDVVMQVDGVADTDPATGHVGGVVKHMHERPCRFSLREDRNRD